MRGLAAVAAVLIGATRLWAEPQFSMPVACEVSARGACYIQTYVDRDPTPGTTRDFRCGGLARDGHNGTDFALRSLSDMAKGVAVIAAAQGHVKATRDGMAETPFDQSDLAAVEGRECGNAVVIAHKNGWSTQYCHLKKGSLRVKTGDTVTAGTPLGLIGLSGKTTFPHLHLTVRRGNTVVDPFAPKLDTACQADLQDSLWQTPPAYHPTGLIRAGFAATLPDYEGIKAGAYDTETLPLSSRALVLWIYAFGGQTGDLLRFRITDEGGRQVHKAEIEVKSALPLYFRGSGRRTASASWWRAAKYMGTITLIRDGTVIAELTTAIEIVPDS